MSGFLVRSAVPLGCALVLAATGITFVLLPLEAAGHSCGGNALAVWVDDDPSTRHGRECQHKAVRDTLFGSALVVVGVGLAGASVLLRRPQ